MRKIALTIAILGTTLLPVLYAAPAHAQATRTWVSGVGDDANPCSRTAPCKTFAGAISKTAVNGEINCLDPGGFGAVTIIKGMTIDCHEIFGSILVAGTNGIVINAPAAVVTIRNLNFDGSGLSGLNGISITAASKVNIEDCMIMQFSQKGISDTRSGAGNFLFVKNTVIRNNTGTGVTVAAGATSAGVLENIQSIGNGQGVAAATGNNVILRNSVVSANGVGVNTDAGSQVFVDNVVITNNSTGVSPGGTVVIANSDVAYNPTAFSGATTSFGNNRIFGNISIGTTPTLGAASSDHGQQ